MIIFSCLKKDFMEYVKKGIISNKVYDAYKSKLGKKTKLSQIKSWANSLPQMAPLLEDLPDNIGISIEFNIPLTSKRVDFVISGYDEYKRAIFICIELKQWSYAKDIKNSDALIKTQIENKEKSSLHPSYQVSCYAQLLENYNHYIEKNKIKIYPLVYLHNYHLTYQDDLLLKKFKVYYDYAPIYGIDEKSALKEFLNTHLKYGDNLEIINNIDKSPTKPNKKLLNAIDNMIKSKKEYTLLDEQKEIAEIIKKEAKLAFTENKKRVVIVKGGPGTGKSVLAIVLLGELLKLGMMGAYVSKSMAPRKIYKNSLVYNNEISIHELFKSSGYFLFDKENQYDFLLIDEAHRLQEKSGIHQNIGENQIKEIIKASLLSVFFIDERQKITLKDIGSIPNIEYYAKKFFAPITKLELQSEFRCNGSDSYLDFLNQLLYNKRVTAKFNFDFQVIDSPNELRDLIKAKNTNNNARLVAGFCWKRNASMADNQNYMDIKIDDFEASWNLKHGEPFATRENAINEVGCIYNVQGLEFDYIGVIIGPDLTYENGLVKTDYKKRASTEKSLYGLHVLMREDKNYYEALADQIIRNTYRVLLSRGLKGCYIYACSKSLQKHLKKIVQTHKISS